MPESYARSRGVRPWSDTLPRSAQVGGTPPTCANFSPLPKTELHQGRSKAPPRPAIIDRGRFAISNLKLVE